jgi:hypothetical protein
MDLGGLLSFLGVLRGLSSRSSRLKALALALVESSALRFPQQYFRACDI